jgi:alanyl-tRNA synthetase
VIQIGDFSTELCGGTHLDATGQIALLKVMSEGAVASGVRRIEAVTGDAARRHVARGEAALREAAGLLKIPPLELPRRLQKLLDEQRQLEKQLAHLEARLARSRAEELVGRARQVAGVPVLAARLDGLDPEGLRSVVDMLRDRLGSGVICLGSVADGKVNLVASTSKDLAARFPANKLVQEVARRVGGGGGGRSDLAQAGGKDPAALDGALAHVAEWVSRMVGERAAAAAGTAETQRRWPRGGWPRCLAASSWSTRNNRKADPRSSLAWSGPRPIGCLTAQGRSSRRPVR